MRTTTLIVKKSHQFLPSLYEHPVHCDMSAPTIQTGNYFPIPWIQAGLLTYFDLKLWGNCYHVTFGPASSALTFLQPWVHLVQKPRPVPLGWDRVRDNSRLQTARNVREYILDPPAPAKTPDERRHMREPRKDQKKKHPAEPKPNYESMIF